MADYTPILDTQTDPDAPLTSDLAKAWTENLIATAEGASGAPRIAQKVLITQFDVGGTVTTGLNGWQGFRADINMSSAAGNLIIELGNSSGVFGAAYTVTIPATTGNSISLFMDITTGSVSGSGLRTIASGSPQAGDQASFFFSGSAGVPAGVVDRVRLRTGNPASAVAMFTLTGATATS